METLTKLLRTIDAERPIVLGISRGGVRLADALARALGAPLDVIPAHKVVIQDGKALAIGAVAVGGVRIVASDAIEELGLDDEDVAEIFDRAVAELGDELAAARADWPMPDLTGHTAFLVDDGAVTGLTVAAAGAAVRDRAAAEIIAVLPWCSVDAIGPISRSVDRVLSARRVLPPVAAELHMQQLVEGAPPPTPEEIHDLLTRRLYDLGIEGGTSHAPDLVERRPR